MTKLQIRREFDALGRGYVAVGNEHHVCNWATRKQSAANKLAYKIYTTVLVRDRHNYTNWNEEECTDRKGK
jgi:hypothetical protein